MAISRVLKLSTNWTAAELRNCRCQMSRCTVEGDEENAVPSMSSPFSLGMEAELLSDSDEDTPAKNQPISSLREKPSLFEIPVVTETEAESSTRDFVPLNTEKNDRWATNTFNAWVSERNKHSQEQCPDDVLERDDAELLNKWLTLFVAEVRKVDGSRYPPKTIHSLLCGLQRHFRRSSSSRVSMFDKSDVRFRSLRNTMEVVFQSLHEEGIGVEVRHVSIITEEEEERLWQLGVLGDTSPKTLVHSVFFLNGKNFCLRGGRDHRNLKLSQFVREMDNWRYTPCAEAVPRINRIGLAKVRCGNKVLRQYPSSLLGRRCHVYLLDLYMRRLPREAMEKDAFYYSPLQSFSREEGKPWFSAQPLGRNRLDRVVKEVCLEAGIEGKSSQSLRVTRKYRQEVPERAVQRSPGPTTTVEAIFTWYKSHVPNSEYLGRSQVCSVAISYVPRLINRNSSLRASV